MAYLHINLEREDHLAILSLSRTESLNALNSAFAAEITETIRDLNSREQVRVIILKSDARIFCAGLDLKEFTQQDLNSKAKNALDFPRKLHFLFDCCNVIEECRKPIIAAIHGKCIGGGLDLVAACDIRLCTEDSTFSLKEAGIGLVADMGALQRLPRLIGEGFTKEMAFTARDFSAREAERMGLINAVYPDQKTLFQEAKKLAAQIAANAPLAVQSTKEVLNYSRHVNTQEGMLMAIHKNMVLLNSEDLKEAMAAFGEKRKPNFKGE